MKTRKIQIRKNENKFTFVLSTDKVARDGEVWTRDGWDFSNFENNPIFLADHEDTVENVVGKVENLRFESDGLIGDVVFADEENPKAKVIKRLYESGFLNSVSVRVFPKKGEYREVGKEQVWHLLEKELLEVSAVALPADPNALLQRGILRKGEVDLFKKEDFFSRKAEEWHEAAKLYRKTFKKIAKLFEIEPEKDEKRNCEKVMQFFTDLKTSKPKKNSATPKLQRTCDKKELEEIFK